MFQTIRNAWALPDLRKKLLYTLFIIVIFRIGSVIPVPFINASALQTMMSANAAGGLFGYIDALTGGSFSRATLFAMSVTPYINASIIIQLLTIAIPALERLQKEGEVGRKQMAQITRYVTIGLGVLQGLFYYIALYRYQGALAYTSGPSGVWCAIVIIAVFSAGTALMMWLGEQINEKGIGNGISILLFAGIVSRGPAIVQSIQQYWALKGQYYVLVPLIGVLAIAVIAAIVYMYNAERRIPVQYAKRVVGRRMYGGQNTFIPIKVTMSGVMPIIFAMSFVSIPETIAEFVSPAKGTFWYNFLSVFNYRSWAYAIIYFLLIIAFNYFYTQIQYNPHEMANNLKKNNGGIPGIRPGKPTSDYINHILYRITLIGALFLGAVAILPIAIAAGANMNIALGGTSMLIIVGVALDTMRQLESQMMMRHYKGFLE